MRSNSMMSSLRMLERIDSNMSTGSGGLSTAREQRSNAKDSESLLEDDDLELQKKMCPFQLEASQQVVKERRRWYHSPAWLVCFVLLVCLVVLQNTYLITSCGYEDGFKTDLGKQSTLITCIWKDY